MEATPALAWDLYCRVVDNYGDIGVCWRLARRLASRGDSVRLVTDDARALAWMAPEGDAGVTVQPWPGSATAAAPADVVLEAFGCDPPQQAGHAMHARGTGAPVWINLEYLSAEDYVERSHGLPSPRPDGLRKWFFYPGFTERTGGLLREPGLEAARSRHDAASWLAAHGCVPRTGERVASLFCYDNPLAARLLDWLAATPTLLLLTPDHARRLVEGLPMPPGLRTVALPWLSQDGYDRLLWSCDLNFVRGEDSLVRAIWAGVPFVWQAYPQHDGAHLAKVEALLQRLALPEPVAALWRAWNGCGAFPAPATAAVMEDWHRACATWRDAQARRPDLASALRRFALDQRGDRTTPRC